MPTINSNELAANLLSNLTRHLEDGEKILWQGQSSPSGLARKLIPAAIVGLVFAVAGACAFVGGFLKAEPALVAFGALFAVIGLGIAYLPIAASKKAKFEVNAVTNKRVLMVFGKLGDKSRTFNAADIGEIVRTDRPDGTGDVYFHRADLHGGRDGTMAGTAFISIRNPQGAEKALQKLAADSGASQTRNARIGPK